MEQYAPFSSGILASERSSNFSSIQFHATPDKLSCEEVARISRVTAVVFASIFLFYTQSRVRMLSKSTEACHRKDGLVVDTKLSQKLNNSFELKVYERFLTRRSRVARFVTAEILISFFSAPGRKQDSDVLLD